MAVSNQQFTNADSPSGLHGNEYVRDADTAKDLKQKLCEIDKKVFQVSSFLRAYGLRNTHFKKLKIAIDNV